MRHASSLLLASLLFSLAACSGADPSDIVGGARQDPSGAATQGSAGTAAGAQKPASGASSGQGAAAGSGGVSTGREGASSGTASGPVAIKNFSIAQTESGLALTFALANTSKQRIERVQQVSFRLDSGAPATFPVSACQDASWWIGAGGTSGVLELDVTAQSPTSLTLRYGGGCAIMSAANLPQQATAATIELRGLLEDATPWKAEATTAL